MDDIRDGFLSISVQLTVYPGFSFEQFKHTKFYRDQTAGEIQLGKNIVRL